MLATKTVQVFTLTCSGCGVVLPISLETEEETRKAAKDASWKYVRLYKIVLDICPACQDITTEIAEAKTTGK